MTLPAHARTPLFVGSGRVAFGDASVPSPGAGELLVEVRANAVCGTDRAQFYNGSTLTAGHEMAGVVAAAGRDCSTPTGTRGVVFLMDYCGTCRSCTAGATNQCLGKRGDVGFTRDGGYGPYALVSESAFFPTDARLGMPEATLLLDVMGTSRHALDRGLAIRPGAESLLVVGAGPVGLGVLAMARLLLGPDIPILVSDVVAYRLELAEELGGLPVRVDETTPAVVTRRRLSGGIDLAVDTSGRQAGRDAAMAALAQRGALVCVGHGEALTLDVSVDLIAPERAVLGSEYFPFALLEPNHRLLLDNRESLSRIITHRFPVEELQAAMELFFSGRTGKVVIEQDRP
jgi:threonine 3-dehydrogenase